MSFRMGFILALSGRLIFLSLASLLYFTLTPGVEQNTYSLEPAHIQLRKPQNKLLDVVVGNLQLLGCYD